MFKSLKKLLESNYLQYIFKFLLFKKELSYSRFFVLMIFVKDRNRNIFKNFVLFYELQAIINYENMIYLYFLIIFMIFF